METSPDTAPSDPLLDPPIGDAAQSGTAPIDDEKVAEADEDQVEPNVDETDDGTTDVPE